MDNMIIDSILKTAGLFTSQEAYDKYKKEHPNADMSNHKVVKAPTTKAKDRMQMINYKGLKDTHDELKKHLGDSVYKLPGDEKNLHFVNYKALQDAKDILKKKKLDFNIHKVHSSLQFINKNANGLSYDSIAKQVYDKVKNKRDWEKDAEKALKFFHLAKDEETEIMNMLRGEDYFDTGDIVLSSIIDSILKTAERKESELVGTPYEDVVNDLRDAIDNIRKKNAEITVLLHAKDPTVANTFKTKYQELHKIDTFLATLL